METEALPAPVVEDRKLSAVKSWFTRSVSFGGVHGSATAAAAAAASKGLSEGHGQNGEDQETWGGFNTTLKQLSMRRTKFSNENERETVLGSPSMTPRNVTPLVPLTSLRWKSNPTEQDSSEPEKAGHVERSRLGLSVTSARSDSEEVQYRNDSPTQDNRDEANEDHDRAFKGFYPNGQTAAEEEDDDDDDGDDQSSSLETSDGHDLKSASSLMEGEDVMTMTIDFLRARLLSERSASKAAKERIQELGKKVVELEQRLEQVIEDKKKAEKSAEEALLKLLTGDFAQVADCTARAARTFSPSEGLHVTSGSGSGGEEIKEELRRDGSSVGGFSRTDSIASSLESKDSGDSTKKLSQGRNHEDQNGRGNLWVTPKNMLGPEGESPKKSYKRAAIENRLRTMWSQISADMSALAGDGSEEALVQEQLMNWMDQVPLVLQDRDSRKSVDDMQFNSATEKNDGKQDSYYSQDSQYLSPPEGVQAKNHVRQKSEAEIMLEEYEAHKRIQREWERNYYESKQRLEQSKSMEYGFKELDDGLPTPHFGVHRSKSSIDFRHPLNNNLDHRQRLGGAYPALTEHPHRPAERLEALPRAHEPLESREWSDQQLQQEYPENYFQQPGSQGVRRQIGYPPSHPDRDSQPRPYTLASSNRSAEDAFRVPPGNTGGAHPMWEDRDYRGGLVQTQLDDHRQSVQGDSDSYRTYLPSEKPYRHIRRRSLSADSSNWPTEEDTRVLDHVPPHQQRLSGEMKHPHPVYPGKTAHNSLDNCDLRHENTHGMTGHRQDKYLDAKTNGSGLPQANQAGPAKSTEPPLYLGYGPAYDAPRDDPPSQPLQPERVSNKSVADVLLALQKAKASIRNSSNSDRVPFAGFSVQTRAISEPMKYEYGLDPHNHIPSVERGLGATGMRPSNSSRSVDFSPPAMDLRPAANDRLSYVDQLNVGKGIDFFF